eukprot:8630383-Alexandrium_andersonii.AAC.1
MPRSPAIGGQHDAPEVAPAYCFLTEDTGDRSLAVSMIKDWFAIDPRPTPCCAMDSCVATRWAKRP